MKPLPFLLFIFAAHFLVFLVSKITLTFISVGMMFPVILLTVLALRILPRRISLIILTFILLSNIFKVVSHPSIFKTQPGMDLKTERMVVAKTYEIAGGNDFSINTITNPYLMPTLWSYHYGFYAREHEAKLPYYRGITAYTYAGEDILPKSDTKRFRDFLIVEPEVGVANSWANQLMDKEQYGRNLLETISIGGYTLMVYEPAG